MKQIINLLFLCLIFASATFAQDEENRVLKIIIDSDINPVTLEYIKDGIERADEENFECLLIQMDTPGGLLESTKDIVKAILQSPVPVVMYVSPSGSGAVSAGVFITMSCHIAVMAEGTNIGAAHPVGIGGQQDTSQVMGEKVTNWASAWARGIAEKRDRNADWAEQAVRKSVSINEDEALELNVIDYVCFTEKELLDTIDGDTVIIGEDQKVVVNTADAKVVTMEMNWRYRILNMIVNPNIAYILMILGIYGLFFELQNPGAMIPGILGAIFLILAFFALQTLPVRSAGVLLILLAIILFILEIKVTSFGILTVGGIAAMFLGALLLFEETPGFNFGVDWKVALTVAVLTGLFFVFALGLAIKARMTKPTTGREGLIDATGIVLSDISPDKEGDVKVQGEIWKASSDQSIQQGERIIVRQVDGLLLNVRKIERS